LRGEIEPIEEPLIRCCTTEPSKPLHVQTPTVTIRVAAVEDNGMLALSTGLLRTGLALKLNQIKRATRSYLRDRTNQATSTASSYAVAAGLFAAAGIFLIAALLVGATALFRWIEIKYGLFWAFGVTGGLLLVIAAICAALAAGKLKRPSPDFPSLGSRLRVALKASPITPDRIESAGNTAAAISRRRSAPETEMNRGRRNVQPAPARDNRSIRAGLIMAATLLGWAAARRRQLARRTVS
jgi:Putative Actinobacterial Holin-X, holin superfamily III